MADQKEISYLYKITNPKGKVYIGQTVNPHKRFMAYSRNEAKAQKRLSASIGKYGWGNHQKEIICSFSLSEIDYAEKYLIAYYNSTGVNGLNILDGGQIRKTKEQNERHSLLMRGRKQSDEQRRKRGISLRGNKNAFGSKRTGKFKTDLSVLYVGKPKLNLRKPISAYYPDGRHFKNYGYALETINDGFYPSCVTRVCNGKGNSHKGFIFKYS